MVWDGLFEHLRRAGLNHWAAELEQQSSEWLRHHGDYPRWAAALQSLPEITDIKADFNLDAITLSGRCEDEAALLEGLRGLMPWRKGPFQVGTTYIDSEWRSDMKWRRVLPQLAPLRNKRVLDIGCGNGYHCWRMLAQSPALVLGIEPSVLFNLQFQAIQKYLHRDDIYLLPLGVEAMPEDLGYFDSVFSMGVFYHRKSPIEHLYQLKSFLVSGGELCLETLVIEGGEGRVLLPSDRYARMRNVWFIPSAAELVLWLERCGFVNVRVVDETMTGIDEQRSTEWMTFESLPQCLDAEDNGLTVEGYAAPRRAVLLANRP